MVEDPYPVRAFLGIAGNVTDESLQQFILEWILRRGDGGNSGSRS